MIGNKRGSSKERYQDQCPDFGLILKKILVYKAAMSGGWFHSGDLGVLEQDRYLTVVDRKKDMIKTSGENVDSREAEEAVSLHPGVEEVAVVAKTPPEKY